MCSRRTQRASSGPEKFFCIFRPIGVPSKRQVPMMEDLLPLAGADTFPHARKPIQPSTVDLSSSRAPCPCASATGGGSHNSDAENVHAALHPLSQDGSQFDAGFTIKAHSSVRELGDAVRASDEVAASAAGAGALEDDAYRFRKTHPVLK